jgi:thiamine-phosphate pyrophosphorylase
MGTAISLRGLYAITDATLQPAEQLTDRVRQAIDGGAALIQYRDKSAAARLRLHQARALAELCRSRDVTLIINDDVALAADCGAQGVHLGRDDSGLSAARRLLGDSAVIGISCYNELERARRAVAEGADYLAFGRFFPSHTKPDAVLAAPGLIRACKQHWPLPVAAIGGITAGNAAPLLAAGADMLAVVHGIFATGDVRQAAAAYALLFSCPPAQAAAARAAVQPH